MATLASNERLRELAERCEMSARSRRGLGMTQNAVDEAAVAGACIRAVIAARALCEEWDQESRTRSAHTPELLQLSARTLAHCARRLTAALGEHEGVGRG